MRHDYVAENSIFWNIFVIAEVVIRVQCLQLKY